MVSYTRQKMNEAKAALRKNRGVKQALCDALYAMVILNRSDFPNHLMDDVDSIQEDSSRVEPVGNEGSIKATLNVMSPHEMNDLRQRILSLAERL